MNIIKALIIIVFIAISLGAYGDHKTFINTLKQQIDDISIKQNKKNREYIYKELREIVQNNVDLKKISRFVMGKHLALTSEKKKEDFLREYEIYFTQLCIKLLYRYMNSSEMIIMGSRKIDDKVYLINTRFSYDDGEFTNIDFKITENNYSFLISDIVVSGISISINQRTKFSEKIDTYGVASVIDELKCSNEL